MRESKSRIPKKFSNVDKTFVNRLLKDEDRSIFSTFSVFPKKLNFYGKEPEEEIILVVRSHWIAYVPGIIFALLFLILPILITYLSREIHIFDSSEIYIGMIIVGFMLSVNILVTTILKWYYTVNIITDQRIVVVRMDNAFYHSYSEAQLEKIEDVSHRPIGIWSNIFDVGDVDIDTAGHEVDFHLKTLPKPRELQDILNDLLEMKQKGKI